MEYTAEMHLLSAKFARDYPPSEFPEILHKTGRAYTCLLIDTHEDFLICVPFRSDIRHNNAFLFSGTARSRKSRSGLDYSKIIIISDPDYIDSSVPAIVDPDEYSEMMRHLDTIVEGAVSYVETYMNHINGTAPIHPRQFARRYQFSTLPYFKEIMRI